MKEFIGTAFALVLLVAVVGGGICGMFYAYPQYRLYNQTTRGEAALREAEYSKKILVETAIAERDSAVFKAQAEVERARGVSEANKIIGDSLEDNDSYLWYLWIQGLHDSNSEVIYVPTEANLPILEAGRFRDVISVPVPVESK